ncbi:putative DNA-directed RNA polymerase I subunit RPA34-like isoform 2 [Scophthalmus maximus]|uniref:Putative DNA-directed RNA polymerase I subunit RPA34-like isoform 2 n=1 Tax=Scophthalmus maximus TaxID=52904 RepID=A0A2U9B3Z7_SCOMX|nr:CD3e molecule, epsilon associated protein isoform X1 [Scophthalmus maximus]AWO98597.1 putative DNA-directed RNA polymerase I subunit RPA34-like isoform 2 [Scophthalmus maximus]
MPRDASCSSSEDEGDNPAAEPSAKRKEPGKTTRYRCPPDFVSLCHKPCGSTLTESLKDNKNELWLIKAPAGFNPECFSGIKFPLSGLQTLKVSTAAGGAKTGSGQQIYSILASSHCTSELRLLTSDKQSSDEVVFGPAFSGLLNVCESYVDSSANMAPQVIPAAPAPSIPPGLKQRFHPFGSKTPTLTCVAENEADGATFGPSSTTLRPLVLKRFQEESGHEEEPKKKKKKKKEKRIKMERAELAEEVTVKVEPAAESQDEVMMELPVQEGDTSEKRKKKKKKKDREREEVEEGVEPSLSVKVEEVAVKCEPIDTYSNVEEGLVKKKKKKKKSKTGDD